MGVFIFQIVKDVCVVFHDERKVKLQDVGHTQDKKRERKRFYYEIILVCEMFYFAIWIHAVMDAKMTTFF